MKCDVTLICRLLGLSLLMLLGGCDGKGHWQEYEKVLGYKGKARLNPFLATQKILAELGHETKDLKGLAKLPAHSAVMFVSGEGTMSAGRARQLLSWVYSGGHLVYSLSGTKPYNDHETQFGTFIQAVLLDEQKDPMLERLGITTEKRFDEEVLDDVLGEIFGEDHKKANKRKEGGTNSSENKDKTKQKPSAKPKKLGEDGEYDEEWLETAEVVKWRGATYRLRLGGYQQLYLDRPLTEDEFSAGPAEAALALHLQHGAGNVTVLAHARPFRNRWIGDQDHARWLAALVGGEAPKEVIFVAATSGSFFGLLWRHGWMAVLAFLALLAFWLWKQVPRFGPPAEVEVDTTRHFASHLGALGEFFWRIKRGPVLVRAAREDVWARIRERHRAMHDGGSLVSDDLAAFLSARSGLPAKRVAAALEAPTPTNAHNFVLLMRDLHTLRRSL